MSLEKVFQRMPELFRPERSVGLTATYLFICGQEEHETFQVSIEDEKISINQGQTKKPDVTVRVASDDWIAISENRLDGLSAYLEGKIKVEGSLSLFQRFPKLFKRIHRLHSGRPLDEVIAIQVGNSHESIEVGLLKPSTPSSTSLWGPEDYLRPVLEGVYSPNAFFLAGHLHWSGDQNILRRFCHFCQLNPIKPPKPTFWKLALGILKAKLRFN